MPAVPIATSLFQFCVNGGHTFAATTPRLRRDADSLQLRPQIVNAAVA